LQMATVSCIARCHTSKSLNESPIALLSTNPR
jgi:hypothetical protein